MAHTHQPDFGTGKKTLPIYVTGIILCVILTVIPFYLVMQPMFSKATTIAWLYIAATAQLFVQIKCFLRLQYKSEQGKANIMTFLFTGVILAVVIGGSLWIMLHLNYNMS